MELTLVTYGNILGFIVTTNKLLGLSKLYLMWRYTGCPRRNVPDFGRVFLMLKYTDITQNTYVQI